MGKIKAGSLNPQLPTDVNRRDGLPPNVESMAAAMEKAFEKEWPIIMKTEKPEMNGSHLKKSIPGEFYIKKNNLFNDYFYNLYLIYCQINMRFKFELKIRTKRTSPFRGVTNYK